MAMWKVDKKNKKAFEISQTLFHDIVRAVLS